MERIANFYGYDIFKPNKKECQQANTPYPMYIAVINYFDEPASEIDMSMSETTHRHSMNKKNGAKRTEFIKRSNRYDI